MSTPTPDPNETSKMKKILSAGNGGMNDSIKSRLPHGNGAQPPVVAPRLVKTVPPPENPSNASRWKFMPAFWTIASLMSITVNIVMLAVVLILLRMLGGVQNLANDRVSGLLGGLYSNFVKMDQATISRMITVDANIPLNLTVPVDLQGKMITLAQDARIANAHVVITQGGVQINAPATVTLPANTTQLNINLEHVDLPVQTTIPIHLEVPVNIPLNETALHEPFVGLRQVVQPYYCLVEPNAIFQGVQVCAP